MSGNREDRAHALAVALVVFVVAIAHAAALYAPNTWINRDGRFYTNMNVTLVEDASLRQERFAASWYDGSLGWNRSLPGSFSNIALGRDGEHWPMHPWLMPAVSTPIFWALGIVGTLVFNLLMFGVIAGSAFVFARAYASRAAASAAVCVFLLGTGIHEYAYDYHVDVFLLAIVSSALAALVARRGLLLGVLVGVALVIKPTSLLLIPAILALLWERRSFDLAKMAIVGGAVVLGLVAIVNTYMFGAPWTFGYMRVLTVEGGEKVLGSSASAFTIPLDEGVQRLWSGHGGVRHRHTMMALALPGLLALLRTKPRYAIAAILTVTAAFLVFAQYQWEHDRFLWPSLALTLAGLAHTLDLTKELLRKRLSVLKHPAVIGALLAVCAVGAALPFEPAFSDRLPQTPYVIGATAAGDGTVDLRSVLGEDYVDRTSVEASMVSRSRFGHWIARTSPPALLVAAPFTAVFGKAGLLVLHVLAIAFAAYAAVMLAMRVAAPAPAVAAVVAPLLLPPIRDAVIAGGPPLLAVALALGGLWLAAERRWIAAGALAAAAAWMVDAPALAPIAVLALAWRQDRRALVRAAGSVAVVLAVWGLAHFLWIGRPFASPEDFVLGYGGETFDIAASSFDFAALTARGSGRFVLALLLLAPLGLAAAFVRDRRAALLLATPVASLFVPGMLTADDLRVPDVVIPLALPLAALATFAAALAVRTVERTSRRTHLIAAGATVLVLVTAGAIWRIPEANAPLQIATYRGVMDAEVLLDDRVPCDFLPWEHMTWECSHFDRGHFNQAGLALPEGVHVAGEPRDLFLIPTGRRGQPRSVTWHDVDAEDSLALRWAIPDRVPGGARLEVRIDDTVVERIEATDDGEIHDVTIDTSAHVDGPVDLTLRVVPLNRQGAAIAVDGTFR